MTETKRFPLLTWRWYVILTGFFLVLGAVVWRTTTLQIVDQDFLRRQGDLRTIRSVQIPATRGMIVDRQGEPLAISRMVKSVWVNPKEVDFSEPKWRILVRLLDTPLKAIQEKVRVRHDKEFLYLRRHLVPELSEQVERLNLSGVYLQSEYRRYYPHGESVSHVLGFTDVDDLGQEGLELAFNEWLTGQVGNQRVMRDRRGRTVENLDVQKPMYPGQELQLSLDQKIQYLAFKALKETVTKHRAEAGSVVILDVETGEVVAMVNQPAFDPNTRVAWQSDGRYRNRAVTDAFEPGSVLKTFSVSQALNSGLFRPSTLIDTSPGWMKVSGETVREDRNKNFGLIDVATVIKKSSNIGVSKMALALPPDQLWKFYEKIGFGKPTESGFPGEGSGTIGQSAPQNPFVLATMAFGYGLTVTPLQLAQAYAILGASGVKKPVSFIKVAQVPKGVQVLDPQVAKQMLEMLGQAADQLGSKTQIFGYRLAGKTGTARKVGRNGYQKDNHVSVFAGLAPAHQPRFAIVVMVDAPKEGGYYGAQVAAPLFSKIAAGALRVYNVPPEAINAKDVQMARTGLKSAKNPL